MNILVVNGHSMRNAGYTAMCRAAEAVLRAGFAPVPLHFTWAANHPGDHAGEPDRAVIGSFFYCARSGGLPYALNLLRILVASLVFLLFHRLKLRPPALKPEERALFQAYASADIVMSCPGNFFYSSGPFGTPFLVDVYSLLFARWLNKPLYLLPQTIGPIRRKREWWLLKKLIPAFRLFFARDQITLRLCQQINSQWTNLRLSPDLAFAYPAPRPAAQSSHCPTLGISVINWGEQCPTFTGQDTYEEALALTARRFIRARQGKVCFFAHVQGPTPAEDDRRALRRVTARLEDLAGSIQVMDGLNDPDKLLNTYRNLDLMLGTRLHSCILALLVRVPILAIEYQYKTSGVLQEVGLAEWVIRIQDANADLLCAALDRLWEARAEIAQRLDREFPLVAQKCAGVGTQIAADYRKIQ